MTLIEFCLYVCAAFIIGRIYIVGKYVRSVNTLHHEDGHIYASILTFGRPKKIDLFYSTEGLATTGSRWWVGKTLTTLAGYPFASFMAFIFFYFFTQQRYDVIFYGLAGTLILNLLLWVRNIYGIVWVLSFIGIMSGLYYVGEELYMIVFLKFVGSVMFVESIASSFTILKLSFTQPNDAGDATGMRNHTGISARVWGLFFFAQSLYFAYLIIYKLFLN